MADVNAPNNGTSADEAPGESGQGFDFEGGYNKLRPEFTRATQDLAESRERLTEYESLFEALHDSDPAIQAQAMEALGLEPAEAGSPGRGAVDDFVDPLEQEIESLRGQVSELTSAREQEAAEKEDQRLISLRDDYIGEAIGFIETETKVKFSKKAEEALGNLSIAMEDKDGMPDVQGAYNLLYGDDGVLELERKRWIDTKSGAAQAPLGRSIPTDQKPKNAKERAAYIDERMRAINDQQ